MRSIRTLPDNGIAAHHLQLRLILALRWGHS